MKLSEELKWRGFWNQTTFKDSSIIDENDFVLYIGTDPSGDSLHVGHLAVYMMVRRFLDRGHKIILLVGGGTGMIGDMRDTKERELKNIEEIEKNKQALKAQVSDLFSGKPFELVDNYDWLKDLKLIPFLRDVGKKFNMAELISRDFFKSRINNGGGLSYAEFSYTLLQGYDYLHLHKNYGANIQIGGSDQWGNLLSGVELIRKSEGEEVYAMTSPLVINKNTGRKFGKSEGEAVWLDPQKTSPYKFYQFWLNSSDEDAIDYLKLFTLLNKESIDTISAEHSNAPHLRIAQKKLAKEVTSLVHGEEATASIEKTIELLFSKNNDFRLSVPQIDILKKEIPSVKLVGGLTISQILISSGIANSKSESKRLLKSNSISINGQKVTEDISIMNPAIVKKGKNQFVLIYK